MNRLIQLPISLAFLLPFAACGGSEEEHGHEHSPAESEPNHSPGETEPNHSAAVPDEGDDHAHDEVPLGTFPIGDLEVDFAQGHGVFAAGKEGHLVVKLPYSDSGATVVRAWIGTEDRTLSYVGKGEYAASHDDYDVHASAPDPLPKGAKWWIEIVRPDGTKQVGSAEPLAE